MFVESLLTGRSQTVTSESDGSGSGTPGNCSRTARGARDFHLSRLRRPHEFETIEQAGEVITACIDRYHDRPHIGLSRFRCP